MVTARTDEQAMMLPLHCFIMMRPKAWKNQTVHLMLRLMTRSRSSSAVAHRSMKEKIRAAPREARDR
jgi:hypothetical protein